ncbi:hypothetical protein BDY19DRAFT_930192 [Irpex rosettiformis]|uniref:Uncharacterized protein n=1 Tax=Irpex rosettiformis TaxID=378272 RepID=A0ACB8UAV9_9APHY|nr:hypothetical protein BDY19DRAFT_930192 [Irpex rosettiformis]
MSQNQRAVLLFRLVAQVQPMGTSRMTHSRGRAREKKKGCGKEYSRSKSKKNLSGPWRMGDRSVTSDGFRKKCTIHTRGMCIPWRGGRPTPGLKPLPLSSPVNCQLDVQNATLRRSALDR